MARKLATVRKLALPALQVSSAGKQINVAGTCRVKTAENRAEKVSAESRAEATPEEP